MGHLTSAESVVSHNANLKTARMAGLKGTRTVAAGKDTRDVQDGEPGPLEEVAMYSPSWIQPLATSLGDIESNYSYRFGSLAIDMMGYEAS